MDQKDLIRLIDEQGFQRKRNGSGHYTIRRRGRFVTTIAESPSDHRATRNAIAQLKKHGLKVPR